jgi:hypothetical protein
MGEQDRGLKLLDLLHGTGVVLNPTRPVLRCLEPGPRTPSQLPAEPPSVRSLPPVGSALKWAYRAVVCGWVCPSSAPMIGKGRTTCHGHGSEAVPQVVDPDVVQTCRCADAPPGLLQVHQTAARPIATDDVGVALEAWHLGQHLQGGGVQIDHLLPCLGVRQPQAGPLEVNLGPADAEIPNLRVARSNRAGVTMIDREPTCLARAGFDTD